MENSNLKIQYAPYVPEIDFTPFIESEDCGIKVSRLIDGAKGKVIIHKSISARECYDVLWDAAMMYVGKFLRNWNGWTWAWYVEEFFKRLQLPIYRNGKLVS